ncbi:MAG: radical SAM protein [Candidatus Bathyarchaeota archaeon]|nr:MAG: radical SAM protein [Candidatus Bathyarchaeota archaeon]
MTESVYTFLSVLNNSIVRKLINSSSKACPRCGKSHLEIALDNYIGNRDKNRRCVKGRLVSSAVKYALGKSGKAFGVSEEQLKQGLNDPYIRRGIANILAGTATFGVTKPQTVGAPFLVVWNYTNACNLKCKHCYQNADKHSLGELSTIQRKEIIDQLDQENVVTVAFSGGEPLMRNDFFEIARYAAKKGIYVSMASNGTMITRSVATRLKEVGVGYVDVSLDGAKPETHESFRGVPGCFEKTIEGIKNLVEGGISTCVAVTATKRNLYEIPKIVELAKRLKVRRIIVFNFIPTGRGQELSDIDLIPTERELLLEYLYDELAKGEIETLCTAPQLARVCLINSQKTGRDIVAPTHFCATDFSGRIKYLTDFIGGCGAGRLYCAVQPNGLVTPCVFIPIVVGDLRKQSLNEIWRHSPVLDDLRERGKLKGRCGRCQFKYVCGGCRARAYAYYQDYLTPDPGCIREIEEPSIEFAGELGVMSAKAGGR